MSWKYGWDWIGASHIAIEIKFADGTIIYLDDGNKGGVGHVFYPGDVPKEWKPYYPLYATPPSVRLTKKCNQTKIGIVKWCLL